MTRLTTPLLASVALSLLARGEPKPPWIDLTTDSGKRFSFAKVMEETRGTKVIPLNRDHPGHQLLKNTILAEASKVGKSLSREGSPAHQKQRINEASGLFENALKTAINALPDFSCQIPRTKEGKVQRSGYPDLRIEHVPTGTVVYLDPKLFEEKSRHSSFRSFYYEAAGNNSKVTEDALHLLLGYPHDGKNGAWKFDNPILVDLSKISLKLKVEFSASNKDLYPEE